MSDTTNGPRDSQPGGSGWWLASDGKWYPPESAPTQAVPTTRPWDAPPPKRGGMSTGAKVALAILAGVVVLGIIGAALGEEDDNSKTVEVAATTPSTTRPEPTTPPTTKRLKTTTVAPTTVPRTAPPPTSPPLTPAPPVEPPPPPPPPIPAVTPVQEPSGNCNPNYSPCVPNASDVDCAGGTGDGPVYVDGPVTVIGDDPYRLDGNNDGIGCES